MSEERIDAREVMMPAQTLWQRMKDDGRLWRLAFAAARTVTPEQVEEAAREACRNVWDALGQPGYWDDHCPDKETWLREEREALVPALASLGIVVEGRDR